VTLSFAGSVKVTLTRTVLNRQKRIRRTLFEVHSKQILLFFSLLFCFHIHLVLILVALVFDDVIHSISSIYINKIHNIILIGTESCSLYVVLICETDCTCSTEFIVENKDKQGKKQ
jgi:hypothetical protein